MRNRENRRCLVDRNVPADSEISGEDRECGEESDNEP